MSLTYSQTESLRIARELIENGMLEVRLGNKRSPRVFITIHESSVEAWPNGVCVLTVQREAPKTEAAKERNQDVSARFQVAVNGRNKTPQLLVTAIKSADSDTQDKTHKVAGKFVDWGKEQ